MAFSSKLCLQKVLNTPLDLKLETFISNSLKYSCLWMNCNRSKIIWYDILKLIYGLNFVIFYLYSFILPEINLFNVTFNAIQPEKSCLADCYLIRLLQCSHSKALPSDSHRFFTYCYPTHARVFQSSPWLLSIHFELQPGVPATAQHLFIPMHKLLNNEVFNSQAHANSLTQISIRGYQHLSIYIASLSYNI